MHRTLGAIEVASEIKSFVDLRNQGAFAYSLAKGHVVHIPFGDATPERGEATAGKGCAKEVIGHIPISKIAACQDGEHILKAIVYKVGGIANAATAGKRTSATAIAP